MRKFRVLVIDRDRYTGIQEYCPSPGTTVGKLIELAQVIFPKVGIPLSESDFQAFAYKQGRWLSKDEILCCLPLEEDTVVLVAISQIRTLGNSIELFRTLADVIFRQCTRPEDQILRILNELKNKYDPKESLLEKANAIIEVHPGIAGISINLNEFVKRLLGKK